MPLPRFSRLAGERRELILRVARAHFARDGLDRASYNQIIAELGISKTSAYQYFDGKEDLFAAVIEDVHTRMLQALTPWQDADSAEEFWTRLKEASERLTAHGLAHPDDLALLNASTAQDPAPWLAPVLDNGRAIGVIRTDVDRELMLTTSAAVLRAADLWLAARLQEGVESAPVVWSLLGGLWRQPDES
ncbi:TetR/AcrR family transcriptional regulator [Kribbella albertanoniae]|uniref:TetR/AcrR family transcriptional regulator n=1 Tax=Kribbella albertanoniae TaxID=1266829 RepID=A0A4R4PXV6_9ACTN|nr:TetR/AcrR family transcriptional regulator [Kribbella albertanoniae]TDC27358.1 TetR/AcrR family transcriptional regulator [Kribbella albertanoniae]